MKSNNQAFKGFLICLAALMLSNFWGFGKVCEAGLHRARLSGRQITRAVTKATAYSFKPVLAISKNRCGAISNTIMSEDKRFLVVAMNSGAVRIWDLQLGQQWGVLGNQPEPLRSIALSSDTNLLAISTRQKTLKIVETSTSKVNHTLSLDFKVVALAFSTDKFVLLISNHGQLYRWSLAENSLDLLGETGLAVQYAEFVNDYCVFLTNSGDVYKLSLTSQKLSEFKVPEGSEITSISLNETSRVLTCYCANKSLVYFDFASRAVLDSLAINMKLLKLASNSNNWISIDESLTIYKGSLTSNEITKIIQLSREPTTLIYDNQYIMLGFEAGTLELWSVSKAERIASMISTETGWVVVDNNGRFMGNSNGLQDVVWQDPDSSFVIPAGNIPSSYYKPDLLPILFSGQNLTIPDAITQGVTLPPNLSINFDEAQQQVTVRGAENRGGGVKDVWLYRNGKRIRETEVIKYDFVGTEEQRKEITKTYKILSENLVSLVAAGANSQQVESVPKEYFSNQEPNPAQSHALHVLTVGIDDYGSDALNLVSAVADADTFQELFFARRGDLRSSKHVSIRNRAATRETILVGLNSLEETSLGDTVLVYLTGHGLAIGEKWYYLPTDIDHSDLAEEVKSKGISSEEIQDILLRIPADRIFLAIDSCQSGGVIPALRQFSGLHALRSLSRYSGIHILAATNREQNALEVDALGHGLLTFSLLQAMQGKGDLLLKDKKISVREVMEYSQMVVPLLSRKYGGYQQFPTAFSQGFDFYLN